MPPRPACSQAAQEGDLGQMALLAQMLQTGYGCRVDERESRRWAEQTRRLLAASQEAEGGAAAARAAG
jgi:TPR repeat protein